MSEYKNNWFENDEEKRDENVKPADRKAEETKPEAREANTDETPVDEPQKSYMAFSERARQYKNLPPVEEFIDREKESAAAGAAEAQADQPENKVPAPAAEEPWVRAEQSPCGGKQLYYRETVKKKQNGPFRRAVALVAVAAVAGGLFGGLGYGLGQSRGRQEAVSASTTGGNSPIVQTASSTYAAETRSATEVIKKVKGAVVNIKTVVEGQQQTMFGYSIPYEAVSAGSGVIFYQDDNKVYVATNNHVIEDAANIYVTIDDETEVPASLVGSDSSADVAVVSIAWEDLKAAGIDTVTCAVFGDSDKLEIGESVIVIGNALAEGQSSTGGMVSALGKNITVNGLNLEVIQTDAAINEGNSGGALVNYNGEVVGIPTAKSFQNSVEGMGYAIPSNIAVPILEELVQTGTVAKPYLGIAGEDITEEISDRYNLPVGVLVAQVTQGGAAEAAGLQKGDIIVQFNGQDITTMTELQAAVKATEIGQTVSIEVVRNGSNHLTLSATIQNANE